MRDHELGSVSVIELLNRSWLLANKKLANKKRSIKQPGDVDTLNR